MKKKVYICAPRGDGHDDTLNMAIAYTAFALKNGVAPLTPHFYDLCLNVHDENTWEVSRSAGVSLLWACEELWIFGDTVTESMQAEIKFCESLHVKIRKIKTSEIKKIISGGTKR